MATKKAPTDTDHARAKLIGTLIGAVVVSLLSSGAFAQFTGEDAKETAKESAKEVLKGSDTGTAMYLGALRDALEARYALQNARIEALEKQVAALQASSRSRSPASELPRLDPPVEAPLPSFEVR